MTGHDFTDDLRRLGYARVPCIVAPDMRAEFDQVTDEMIRAWFAHRPNDPDYWWYPLDDGTPVLYRIHRFETKQPALTTALFDAPACKEVLAALFGGPADPTACALIVKLPKIGSPVPWHRDPVDVPPGRVFNLSFYLDDSDLGNGCLEVVPGSHLTDATVSSAGAVPAPAAAGDVIIHDVRLIHGSGANAGLARRRSLVTEFRSRGGSPA